MVSGVRLARRVFLSTLPARGATVQTDKAFMQQTISIHAPREGSDLDGGFVWISSHISIHAPREGSDSL